LEDMVASGELSAAIGIEVDHPDVKPLIPNAKEAGFEALRRLGHYPINHTVVVKDELLSAYPDLAADIFKAFAQSKELYVQRLRSGKIEKPTKIDELHRRVMEITGRDPLPYRIAPNRQALEEIVQAAVEQKIIARSVPVEELFALGTRDFSA